MNFHVLYRISFYVMLFLASLVPAIDSTDANKFVFLFPTLIAVVSAIAFFTVDKHPHLGLNTTATNLLGLVSPILIFLEYQADENLLLLTLTHWFVYLILIKVMRVKTVKDDWTLFVLGLVQVIVGGVISQSDIVGTALFAWALCALWVMLLLSLKSESERGVPSPGTTVSPALDLKAPYPGLISWPFLFATFRVAATTIALGGVMFLILPRRAQPGGDTKSNGVGAHLTGFDDEVQLGQLGEILENDSIVMTVELSDQDGNSVEPEGEPLWRGVGLDRYVRGRWKRHSTNTGRFPFDVDGREPEKKFIKQHIKLEPTDNPILFSLKPILHARAANRKFAPEFNPNDGSIYRTDNRPISFEYTVISAPENDGSQPGEKYPNEMVYGNLVQIDPALKALILPIATKVTAGVNRNDREAVARSLEEYLRDGGEYFYTLKQDVSDPNIDPIADFLINRKEGHCEYFASALALMLRSLDIPARLVNGFKGGDYNNLVSVVSVRQKHAHSWVEVLVSRPPAPGSRRYETTRWITLDPTPGLARDESIAKVGGMTLGTRQFSDLIRYFWAFYIVGFNYERQQKFLYEPIQFLISEARNGFQIMGQGLRSFRDWLFNFPNLSSLLSLRGLAVVVLGIAFFGIGFFVVRAIVRRVRRAFKSALAVREQTAIGVLIYQRLVELLAEVGLERPDWETPREFARRATEQLAAEGSGSERLAEIPSTVVDAYYRIRFGDQELDTESIEWLESRLNAFEEWLRPAKA
jgi:hypothetical protein